MPRQPGRESTRLTYPLGDLLVQSFLTPYGADDRFIANRVCVVAGCDHRVKNCVGQVSGPAVVVLESNIDSAVGIACAHHVAEMLDQDR